MTTAVADLTRLTARELDMLAVAVAQEITRRRDTQRRVRHEDRRADRLGGVTVDEDLRRARYAQGGRIRSAPFGTGSVRAAKPKTPPAERPPKPDPPKPRPVRRAPAPQRKSIADLPHTPIRKGTQIGFVQEADGTRTQIILCLCGHTYRRPHRPGRIPGTCARCAT